MSDVTRSDVVKMAQDHSDELVQLVSQLIQIPSENPTGTQRDVVDFVENYLTQCGIPWEETGCNPEFPCVVAEFGDDPDGYNMILNGHLDVVPAGDRDQWDYDPFCGTVTDKLILGRGTSDMKSGVAGILYAARILKQSGISIPGKIRMHFVSDEESGGQFGSAWLVTNGYAEGADGCLVAEPTSNFTIEIGQRGQCIVTLKSKGESAHGALATIKGDNAILKLASILDKFTVLNSIEGHYSPEQEHAREASRELMLTKLAYGGEKSKDVVDHVSANVGLITGGTRPNMVPDYAQATIDVRLPLNVDKNEIVNTVNGIIADSGLTGLSADFWFKGEPNATDEYDPLVQLFKKNAEERWGIEVIPAYQYASSDAREYRKVGISTIQYGPANNAGIHSYNENVDIEDVVNAGQIYVASICDLLGIA